MTPWQIFFAGFTVGALVGMLLVLVWGSLCAASAADDQIQQQHNG